MDKRKIILLFVALLFCVSLIQASTLTTKMEFEIGSLSGITQLDNSNGGSVNVSILNSAGGEVVTRKAAAGVYKINMSIIMTGAKFDLNYGTNYTYRLITTYGNFSYNFTTPADPAPTAYNLLGIVYQQGTSTPLENVAINCSGYSYYTAYSNVNGSFSFNVNSSTSSSTYLCIFDKMPDYYISYYKISITGQTNLTAYIEAAPPVNPP